jgi:hypothetical protein
MTDNQAATLENLAGRVRRLSPSHRDPLRWHEERDAIERELRSLARRADSGPR